MATTRCPLKATRLDAKVAETFATNLVAFKGHLVVAIYIFWLLVFGAISFVFILTHVF